MEGGRDAHGVNERYSLMWLQNCVQLDACINAYTSNVQLEVCTNAYSSSVQLEGNSVHYSK